MYKRTIERILAIIGLVIAGLQTGAGIFSLTAAQNSEFKNILLKSDSAKHVNEQIAEMQRVGTSFLTFSGLAFALALVAICLLSKKKRATVPAILLVAAGVLITGNLIFAGPNPGIFAALLLIISGIIAWRKKPIASETPDPHHT
jgi:magnesium-transporting ATPase (P-type)